MDISEIHSSLCLDVIRLVCIHDTCASISSNSVCIHTGCTRVHEEEKVVIIDAHESIFVDGHHKFMDAHRNVFGTI